MDGSVKYGPAENPALKVRFVQRQWVPATHVELGLHLLANKKAVAATPRSPPLPQPPQRKEQLCIRTNIGTVMRNLQQKSNVWALFLAYNRSLPPSLTVPERTILFSAVFINVGSLQRGGAAITQERTMSLKK